MQSQNSVHITAAEWRWVIFVGGMLVALAFIPFVWVAVSGIDANAWQFMGVLNNYRDGATYIAKMVQGMEGSWLVYFRHTPETHSGALLQVIYPALGHVARVVDIQPIALFHAARVVASFMMYLALYYLGASIWMRLRTRRIFFTLAAVGGGLGWLYLVLSGGDTSVPDLSIPEMFAFYSSLVNVHFPLTLACMALLASILIGVFRPGAQDEPRLNNNALAAALLSFTLALLYPQVLVPLIGGMMAYLAIHWIQQRRIIVRELRWALAVILPALPLAAYYAAVVRYNPAMGIWANQNVTPAPSLLAFVMGLGVPLVIALPGLYRAVRRFEPDGDQFMLLWLVVMLASVFAPTSIQRRFAAGMLLLVAYFATRALEDFWFTYVNRRWRYRLLLLVVPLMTFSFFLVLLGNLRVEIGPFLYRNYAITFRWLSENTQSSDVILASEEPSIWIPAWAGTRVVYGHPYETLDAANKRQQVIDWYAGQAADCRALLDAYRVRYVLYGPLERELGEAPCLETMKRVGSFGSVTVYAP